MSLKMIGVVVCLIVLQSASVFAQSTGSINGRVTDPAGAVVVGAKVTATNTGKALSLDTATNSDGLYTFSRLDTGSYDVKVEMNGFASFVKKGVTLVTDTAVTLNFDLSVASTNQQVEVSGEAVMMETTQSDVSATLQTSEVQNLPMLNRNFQGLVALLPGARPAPLNNPTKAAMGAAMSFGGGNGRNVEVNVDGADNKDDIVGGALQNYTIEGIEEFKLLAHDFGPQYGRTNGAVLQIATKSGTNSWHGSAFAYGRNDGMTAIDYFTKVSGLPKTSYSREQFGGSIGGPIKKDKWFIFGAVERVNQNYIQTVVQSAYQAASVLPASVFPNIDLSSTTPQPFNDNLYTIKSDYQINSRHSVFVRWAQQYNHEQNAQTPATRPSNAFVNNDVNHLYSIVASETWLVNNNTVNQFMVQRNDYYLNSSVPADNIAPGNPGYFIAARPVTANVTFPSFTLGAPVDQVYFQKKWQFQDNFSRQMGKHAFKVGGDFSFYPKITDITDSGYTGAVTFNYNPSVYLASQAAWAGNPMGCTLAFANSSGAVSGTQCGGFPSGFLTAGNTNGSILAPNGAPILAGAVTALTQGMVSSGGSPVDAGTKGQKQVGFYVGDDWKVTQRLTLNLGLRYDLDIGWYNQGQATSSRIYQILAAIAPYSSVAAQYTVLPHNHAKDFSPRVGFAWDITGNGKNLLRASFGLFYDGNLTINALPVSRYEQTDVQIANTLTGGSLNGYYFGGPLPSVPPAVSTSLLTAFAAPGGAITTYWYAPNVENPYNEQAHIGYERTVANNTVLSADYTHILGLREYRTYNINPIDSPLWDPTGVYSTGTAGQRVLAKATNIVYPGYTNLLGAINIIASNNRSLYDELNIRLEHRSTRATYQASYVLSSARAWGGTIGSSAFGTFSGPMPAIPFQEFAPGEFGPSALDERHHIVLSGVFSIWKGIQVSPVMQYGSARPYTLLEGSNYFGDGQGSAIDRYYNPANEPATCPAQPLTCNAVGINSQRGIASFDLDARVTKVFNLGEVRKLAFFAEFYNLTNKANFGNQFNGTASSGATFETPNNYLLGYPPSRELQLGARFLF